MANQALELHDSSLAVLWYERNDAILIFSKLYVHECEGNPGIDDGIGWFQRAEIIIKNATLTDYACVWPCQIFGGEVTIDGVTYRNCAPIPLNCGSSFKIAMNAIDGDYNQRHIEIEGDGATLTFYGDRSSVEDFPDTETKL